MTNESLTKDKDLLGELAKSIRTGEHKEVNYLFGSIPLDKAKGVRFPIKDYLEELIDKGIVSEDKKERYMLTNAGYDFVNRDY